jgi:ribose transport system ATP-binding protein
MLELRHITKSFPAVRALDDVSLEFKAGEIHGLIGENGAGKSTAIKILTGQHQPDAGEVWLEGAKVVFRDYRDASLRGIALVSQEISVVPDASVAENVMLDKLVTRGAGVIDWPATRRAAATHLARVGLAVDLDRPVRGLSAAQKQLVQIAKALSAEVKVLLLDEPTSALTEHDARRLFDLLRELRIRGVAIIFVTHKLDEIFAVCDRVSVLRDGRVAGVRPLVSATRRELIELMLGRAANDDHVGVLAPDEGAEMLRCAGVVRRGTTQPVSFSLHRGEILGCYGLIGSGRTELARALIGEEPIDAGEIFLRGQPARISSVEDALYRHRLGYVTENRKEEGLFLDDTVETNLSVAIWPRFRRPLTRRIDDARQAEAATHWVDALQVRTPELATRVGQLSGGNQQKVSIGKWLAADCDILIIDEPTIGVDVGAKEQIHRLIWALASEQKKAVLLISSDLPELVRLANRLLVFREQRIVGEVRDIDAQRKTYAQVSAEIAPWFE